MCSFVCEVGVGEEEDETEFRSQGVTCRGSRLAGATLPPSSLLSRPLAVASNNLLPFLLVRTAQPPRRGSRRRSRIASPRIRPLSVLQESKVAVQTSPLPSLSFLRNCHLPNAAGDPALLSRAGRRARPSRPSRVKHFQATHATALAAPASLQAHAAKCHLPRPPRSSRRGLCCEMHARQRRLRLIMPSDAPCRGPIPSAALHTRPAPIARVMIGTP